MGESINFSEGIQHNFINRRKGGIFESCDKPSTSARIGAMQPRTKHGRTAYYKKRTNHLLNSLDHDSLLEDTELISKKD